MKRKKLLVSLLIAACLLTFAASASQPPELMPELPSDMIKVVLQQLSSKPLLKSSLASKQLRAFFKNIVTPQQLPASFWWRLLKKNIEKRDVELIGQLRAVNNTGDLFVTQTSETLLALFEGDKNSDVFTVSNLKKIQISPDGSSFVVVGGASFVADFEGSIQAWLPLETQAIAFSKTGDFFAIASADGSVRIYSKKGILEHVLPGKYLIKSLAVSPDDSQLLAVNQSGQLLQWDLHEPTQAAQEKEVGYAQLVSITPEGSRVVAFEPMQKLLSVSSKTRVFKYDEKLQFIKSLVVAGEVISFSADGSLMVVDNGGIFELRDSDGARLVTFNRTDVQTIILSPDGLTAAVVKQSDEADLQVELWDLHQAIYELKKI